MELRQYQQDAIVAIKVGFNPPNSFRRQLTVMPTVLVMMIHTILSR